MAVDIELLRRLGILPGTAAPSAGAEAAQAEETGRPVAMPTEPVTMRAEPQPTRTLPWATDEGTIGLPIAKLPGGQEGVLAPEGVATWQRADPGQVQSWIKQKQAEQEATRSESQRQARARLELEVGQQQEQERQRAARQQQMAGLTSRVAEQDPLSALKLLMQQQQTGQLSAAQAATGTPEAQAFRQLLQTQGLPTALAWLDKIEQQKAAGHRGPLTPEQIYARTLAEMEGRYGAGKGGGPSPRKLRTETAEETAAAAARGKGAPDVPLTVSEVQKAGVPLGTTRGQLSGQLITSPQQREKATELDTGRYMLDQIGQLADELITASDAGGAMTQGAALTAEGFLRTNPSAATFADQRKALLGILSRQIGAERGVLTDRDIERLNTALPSFRDTKEVKDRKMAFLRGMFDVSKEARMKAMSSLLDTGAPLGGKPNVRQTQTLGGKTYRRVE